MTTYYDAVLGLIPLALVGIVGTLVVAGFELTTAVPVASSFSIAVIGHALFVNGPVDGETVETAGDDESATLTVVSSAD